MSKVRDALIKLVENDGVVYVAYLIGEKTTRNLSNWISEKGSIPESKLGMIEKILKTEGVIR